MRCITRRVWPCRAEPGKNVTVTKRIHHGPPDRGGEVAAGLLWGPKEPIIMTKRILLALAVALAVVGSFLPRRAAADEVSFSFFYDNLSPYGAWIDVDGYGTCWQPGAISADWAPYTDGSWAYTDAGWTWVSNEDFGEIVYHYGRWVRLEGLGWVWRPDTEWAPAWVSWRSSDDYIGWAPLPPEVPFRAGIGISGWIDDSFLGPLSYSFCLVEDFGAPRLRHVLFGRERNVSIIHSTTNITHITVNRVTNIVHNGGPDYHRVSKRSKRHIERLRLDRRTSGSDYRRGGRAVRSGGALVVHAPRVKKDSRHAPKVSKRWSNTKVDHGWKGISASERERWETKVRDEKRQRSSSGRKGASSRGAHTAATTPDFHNGRKEERPGSHTVDRSSRSKGGNRKASNEKRSNLAPRPAPSVKTEQRGNDWAKEAGKARKKQEEGRKKQQQPNRKKQEKAKAPQQAQKRENSRDSYSRDSYQSRDRGKKQDKNKSDKKKQNDNKKRDKKRDKKKR